MERENFYILLELSCDPPETDPEVIEKAITKKQSEWSRLRNHPTKGLHAQKCINMIPEIRRVMKDDALRAKEAEAARELLARDRESKYPEIDRHIDILMGKGYVTPEEKTRLATVHGLAESEIQNRINARKNEKYRRIDQQITLRMAKGYLTESELEKIAKRNSAKQEEVRQRVRCPVVKTDKSPEAAAPRPLDRSIEKTIHENLKLLNKSSLYDFLGLPESADLEALQKASARKKKELAKSSKKDAVATASNTLAGQCITIFKSEANRIAYDVSLARAKLAALDSDIDIAGINGRVRPEYFEILVNKAMDFGMEKHEAVKYIRDYCRRRKLAIESAPYKRRKYIIAAATAALIVLMMAGAGAYFYADQQKEAAEADFAEVIKQVDSTDKPRAKLQLLQAFAETHSRDDRYGQYIKKAEDRADEIEEHIAEKEYKNRIKKADALADKEQYSRAVDDLSAYLENKPPAKYADRAGAKIKELEQKMESRDFRKLEQVFINASTPEKISAVSEYLESYPEGGHREDAEKMLSEISGEYYIHVAKKLEAAEKDEDWQQCAQLCENYTNLYDNSYSDKLESRLEDYREKIKQNRKLNALQRKAEGLGTDYEAAIEVYEDYLAAYPDTRLAGRIEGQIKELRQKKREKAIADVGYKLGILIDQSGGRYEKINHRVVKDRETGLMWQLLDTRVLEPEKCFSYEEARQYVKSLSAGGYSDWRLPTPEELAEIYKTESRFPSIEKKWYWTSESYSSYSDSREKRMIVDTVSNGPEGRRDVKRRDSSECGTVRAVRD